MKSLIFFNLILWFSINSWSYSKNGTTYTTDGSQTDVAAAIADATAGDTVNMPSGTNTWGASGSYVSIDKVITLNGAGTNGTYMQLSSTGPSWAAGVIRLSAAATVKSFTIIGANSGSVAPFACGGNGWRITGIRFMGGTTSAYFAYTGGYGLIDHCDITGGAGMTELIFGRGPSDSWQTVSSLGTSNAVYIEDCTFGGLGYVCDANSNARFVVRYNTITGNQKIDGHGKASNTPARSVRHMEIYGNTWTSSSLYWAAMELRGGTGMVFDNTANLPGNGAWFLVTEYGCTAMWANFGNVYQTPVNYPIDDQIGVGMDPKSAASEPMYLWNNLKNGAAWAFGGKVIPSGAIAVYTNQMGDVNATFAMLDIIAPNRDTFGSVSSFDGTSGVGRGTAAQMNAITPTLTGVGFWATDEGEWNSNQAGTDGRLYTWNGSAWVLKYTPLIYPHPLVVAQQAGTYYIDYNAADDSANGTSTSTPWKRAPGMKGFGGSGYADGDTFIFKGGVTWPAAVFPWVIQTRGIYASSSSYFTGGSYTRPIFDFELTVLEGPTGPFNNSYCGVFIYANDVTIRSIEMKNLAIPNVTYVDPSSYNGYGVMSIRSDSTSQNTVVQDCYVHHWKPNALNESDYGGIWLAGAGGQALQNIIGWGRAPVGYVETNSSGICILEATIVVSNTLVGAFELLNSAATNISWNSFGPSTNSIAAGAHCNAIFSVLATGMQQWIFNNTIHDLDTTFQPMLLHPAGLTTGQSTNTQTFIYNNLIYNVPVGIALDDRQLITEYNGIRCFVYNNTIVAAGCIGTGNPENPSQPRFLFNDLRNNHFISDIPGITPPPNNYPAQTQVDANNLTLTSAAATAAGYTLGNLYSPTSVSAPSVGAGANLTASNLFTVDIIGNPRPAAGPWTIGAYEPEPRSVQKAISYQFGAAVGIVENTSLTEISGIAASRQNGGVIWAHNDSGDQNRLFAMATNGTHLGIFYLQGASATDWEDMAIGPGPTAEQDYLFVADTGNNDFSRNTVTIYRVPEPSLAGVQFPVQTTLSGVDAFPVRYPDQNRDVETLLVDPQNGDIVLVTRDRSLTGTTYVYVYPVEEQTPGVLATLTYVGAITSSIAIKGGDVSPDGQWVLLRRHSETEPVDGWIYYHAPGTPLEAAFATAPGLVPLAFEPQGEAVTFTPDSTGYYTISEGAAQPIYFYGPLTPPAAPDNGSASALSDSQIRLSWSDNANNEAGYFAERSTDGVNYGLPVVLAANATGYTDSGLTASTLYWYRVTAHNNAGYSASLILTATTTAPPPAPLSAPSGLAATAVSKTQINLRWTDTSNEDEYRIERSTDGTRFTQIASVGANVTSFANSGLTRNKLYYYRVRAYYNAGGYSAYSNIASARTPKK